MVVQKKGSGGTGTLRQEIGGLIQEAFIAKHSMMPGQPVVGLEQ